MRRSVLAIVFPLVLAVLAAPAAAQEQAGPATVRVAVVHDSTGAALERVRVHVEQRPGARWTDRAGRAELRGLPAGRHVLQVSLPGYALQRVPVDVEGQDRQIQVRLRPQLAEVVLEELRVTSWGRSKRLRGTGFYERQDLGGSAQFLTSEEIENRRPRILLDAFRGLRRWTVTPVRGRAGELLMSNRAQGNNLKQDGVLCLPEIYLDGALLSRTQSGNNPGDLHQDLSTVDWNTVEGIEAYASGASIPVQYNSTGSACGVVLIWTK